MAEQSVHGPQLPTFDDVLAAKASVQLGATDAELSRQVTERQQTIAAWDAGVDHKQAAVIAEQEAHAEAS